MEAEKSIILNAPQDLLVAEAEMDHLPNPDKPTKQKSVDVRVKSGTCGAELTKAVISASFYEFGTK